MACAEGAEKFFPRHQKKFPKPRFSAALELRGEGGEGVQGRGGGGLGGRGPPPVGMKIKASPWGGGGLLRTSQLGKDEEGDDALIFGRVVRFRPTIIFKGGFQGRVHKECIRINRSVPRVACTVSKSAKPMEQQFKVCYSRTQKFFTVPLDPQ